MREYQVPVSMRGTLIILCCSCRHNTRYAGRLPAAGNKLEELRPLTDRLDNLEQV